MSLRRGHRFSVIARQAGVSFERAETLARFKRGELKYLVNVKGLTTGFDAPTIDCIALRRPTSLAPDIIEAILRGDEPDGLSRARPRGLSLEKLRKNLPVRWDEQRRVYV